MNKITKIVNIYPTMPITGINPPIRSTVKHVTKSIDEIRTCLMARALVEEILSNGDTVRLNIGNYDKCLDKKENKCACGKCECKTVNSETLKPDTTETPVVDETKSPWKAAYDKALEGKNLASMTRKQRRSAEAAAKAIADAAVTNPEEEVVMGVGSIETVESAETADEAEITTVENTVEVEEAVEVKQEEVVKTDGKCFIVE